MSSTALPSASNDYAAPIGMTLTKAAWDAALTDVGARLRAAEAIRASFQALIDAGTGQALAVIQTNVGPQLAALQAEIAAAQAAIITAQGQVANLLSGNMPADHVIFTPTGTIASGTVQGAIAEVASDAAAAIAAKADASALAANVAATAAIVNQKFLAVAVNTLLVAGSAYRITGGSSITLTLPLSPATGDTIRIVDGGVVAARNRPTIAGNGNTIMGASVQTIDVPGLDLMIWWNGFDWRLF